MKKIARVIFILVACIMPIFIGLLHTATHFNELMTPEIQGHLQKEVDILGEKQPLLHTWGIVSFMMGASFVVIGVLNISMLKLLPKTAFLPTFSILIMLLYQLCVTYVGFQFEQVFQLYGGMFGVILLLICMYLNLKNTNDL